MATDAIVIHIKADDDASTTLKKLRDEIDALGKSGAGAGKKVGGPPGKKGGGLGSALGGLAMAAGPYGAAAAAIGGALLGIGKASIGAAAEMEKLTSQMAAALPATESADARMAELVQTSKEMVGLDLKNMVKFDTQLRSVGLNSKQIDTTIQSVTKSMSAQGKSSADTARVLDQLQQAFAGGAIKAEDMKTVFREMPGFQNAVKKAFGENVTSIDKFRDAANAAGLTAEQALISALTELDNMSEGASLDTFAAQSEMLGENFSQLGAKIGAKVLPMITWLIKGLNTLLDNLPAAWEWVKNFFTKTLPELWNKFVFWIEGIGLKAAEIAQFITGIYRKVIMTVIGILDKITGIFGFSIKDLIAKIPIVGKLLSDEQLKAEKAYIAAQHTRRAEQKKQMEDAKAAEEQAKKDAAAAVEREKQKLAAIEANAEAYRVAARDKRIEFLDKIKTLDKTNFDARRTLVKEYYDAVEAQIQNSALTEEQKAEELKLAEKNRADARKAIKKDETAYAISQLNTVIEETKNANEALAADENTTREAMKKATNDYYDKLVERARLQITDAEKQKTALEKIRGDRDAAIRKVDSDYDKRDAQRKAAALKRQQELDKQLAAALTARATKAKRDLDAIVTDTDSSLAERKRANDTYYAHLTAQELQREKDTSKHQDILFDLTKQRLDAEKTLTANYWAAHIEKQDLSLRAMAVNEDTSIDERKAKTEELFNLKAEKIKAEEQDAKVRDDKLALNAHALQQELKALDDEATARDTEATQKKIANFDELIQKQELTMSVLDTNETASVDERIRETERLHNLKADKIRAEETDATVIKNKLTLLEQETANKIQAIHDASTAKRETAQLTRVQEAEAALNDIVNDENAAAEDINAAAQLVYEEKKAYVDEYVDDEEEAAELIEGYQKDLDAARTSSMEQFWQRHGQLVQQGLDIALQAAETEIKLMKGVRDAERDIQAERARARVEFDSEWANIVAGYDAEMELARIQAKPLIEAAFERGDEAEGNRLQAELDKLIGQTQTGQVLLDEHGNQMGLLAERTAALQEITNDINEAELDYFAEIRDIQAEARQQRAKAWWELGGQLVGQALGAGVSYLSGGAIDPKTAMAVGGDIGKFIGSEIGDIHAGSIEDKHLRRELEIYQKQQQLKADNIAKGILSSTDLSSALRGTDFDPAVIAQKELDAQAAIQKRIRELHQARIEDVEWTMEQEKRAFDRLREDQDATLADLTARYDVYRESQETLARLRAKDEDSLNRELRRIWWQRVDTLDAVNDAIAAREKQPAASPGAEATPTADTTTPARRRDSGSPDAGESQTDYRTRLRWNVEDKKYYLDKAVADEASSLETLRGLHDEYWQARKTLANAQAKTQAQRDRNAIVWERDKLDAFARLEKAYYDGVERRRAADLRRDQEAAAAKTKTQTEERQKDIKALQLQVEDAAYHHAQRQSDEEATLAELQASHTELYNLKKQLAALEASATGDILDIQRAVLRVERARVDTLNALNAAAAQADERKKAEEQAAALKTLQWEIETASHLFDELQKKEKVTLAELQASHAELYALKKKFTEDSIENATEETRALERLERERVKTLSALNAAMADAEAARKEEVRQKNIATLQWEVETAGHLLEALKKKEDVTLAELAASHANLYQLKRDLTVLSIKDATEEERALERLDRERAEALAALQKQVADAAAQTKAETAQENIATLQWEVETAEYLLAQLQKKEDVLLSELQAQHAKLWDFKKQLITAEITEKTEQGRALERLDRERAEALIALEQQVADATKAKKAETLASNIAALQWEVETAEYLFDKLQAKEGVTLTELTASHTKLYALKRELTHAEVEDIAERNRQLERLERERTDAMAVLTAAAAKATEQEKIKAVQWYVENASYQLAQLTIEEGVTLEALKGQHRALWEFKKQLLDLEITDATEHQRASIRLERERSAALTTLETDYYAVQQRIREKDAAKKRGEAADEKAETLDDLKWEIETTAYYLNRIKANANATYQEIAARQTLLFDLRVKQAELTAKDEEDATRATIRLEREHTAAMEALRESFADKKKRAREAELAERQSVERDARDTAIQEGQTAADAQQEQQQQIATSVQETTADIVDTSTRAVETQTTAAQTMMQGMATSAQESSERVSSVASTMRDLGKTLTEQTTATIEAMTTLAEETVAAFHYLLGVSDETSAQRVTTETDADAEILDSRETTATGIETKFDGLYSHLSAAGETWKTGFESHLTAMVTTTATQLPSVQSAFQSVYTAVTGYHNAFGTHFIQTLNFASALVEFELGARAAAYDAFYTELATARDTYLGEFATSLAAQMTLTEAATTAMQLEYTALYDALRHQAAAYAEYQAGLVADLSDSLTDIQAKLTAAETATRELRNTRRRETPMRDRRSRELFHTAEMDAIAAAGGGAVANAIKRQNANDFTEFFSKEFLETWRATPGTSSLAGGTEAAPQEINIYLNFDDGTTRKLHQQTLKLEQEKRL